MSHATRRQHAIQCQHGPSSLALARPNLTPCTRPHLAQLLDGLQHFGVDLCQALAQLLVVGALGAQAAAHPPGGGIGVRSQRGVVPAGRGQGGGLDRRLDRRLDRAPRFIWVFFGRGIGAGGHHVSREVVGGCERRLRATGGASLRQHHKMGERGRGGSLRLAYSSSRHTEMAQADHSRRSATHPSTTRRFLLSWYAATTSCMSSCKVRGQQGQGPCEGETPNLGHEVREAVLRSLILPCCNPAPACFSCGGGHLPSKQEEPDQLDSPPLPALMEGPAHYAAASASHRQHAYYSGANQPVGAHGACAGLPRCACR